MKKAGPGLEEIGGLEARARVGQAPRRDESLPRRLARRAGRRLAVLAALFILYYATSLHGVSLRTLVLVGVLLLFLYWVFKEAL